MKKYAFSVVSAAVVITVAITACTSSDHAPAQNAEEANAAKRDASMHALARTISELLPLVASRSKFADLQNKTKIETETAALRDLAHSIADTAAPGSDPGAKMVQEFFADDISRALESYRSGQTEYARHVLKDTTNYCIQCHTYSDATKTGARINLDLTGSELSPIEKAEFYAATRQNDRALEAYTKALGDPEVAEKNPFEWELAARTALAIAISRDLNPKSALKLVNEISKNPKVPKASVPTVKAWKKSIADWSRSAKRPKSSNQRLETAQSLLKTAQSRQEFPLDHTQDILYFRASSLLHDTLKDEKIPKTMRADALYWSGIAADATRDMSFWTLHETYFEQCIRLVPGTPRAKECFAKIQDSVVLGYSGSAGTNIPPAQQKRLDNLAITAGVPKAP
ncbi:MAG: hypothetical protein V4692_12935 [Bdellovibrionota bacterium]